MPGGWRRPGAVRATPRESLPVAGADRVRPLAAFC
jgi:hypothetical protein